MKTGSGIEFYCLSVVVAMMLWGCVGEYSVVLNLRVDGRISRMLGKLKIGIIVIR